MEVIDLRKYRWRGGGDGGAARDAKLRWLQSHDDDHYDNDDSNSDKDFFEHGEFSGLVFVVMTRFRDLPGC
jgi:hypothetical protein